MVYPCNVAHFCSVSLENEKRFPIRTIINYFYVVWHYIDDASKRLDRFNNNISRNVFIIRYNVSGG